MFPLHLHSLERQANTEMERWEKPQREDKYRHRRRNPSFSSTLLDTIYRSIDESNDAGEKELILHRDTMRKKQSGLIEQWMEKKGTNSASAVPKFFSLSDYL
ncbi:hypothetical protein NE237_014774 [Protea cynaroides]|uniref:Uncharacterized protein n=1 Tax=Protea cynaroides TaxID=273540 RepID=A0A9Q0KCL2_9MAGN|nr:hypothetical protein NE237_014774 [Protea cynaroides]